MKKVLLLSCCLVVMMIATSGGNRFLSLPPSLQAMASGTDGDWPTYLYNQTRTGANPDETSINLRNANRLHLVWKFTTGGVVGASPTLVNGNMYIGSWDGYEYAVDISAHKRLWKQYLGVSKQSKRCYGGNGIGIDSTATVENNVVYVGGGDGYMYALKASNGSVIWKTLLGKPPYYNWSSPLLYNNKIYIGLAAYCDPPFVQGKVMALRTSDGSVAASISLVPNGQTGAPVWGSAAVDSSTNTIYVATGNNGSQHIDKQPNAEAILALDAHRLTIKDRWQIPAGQRVGDSDFGTTPVLFNVNGKHYIGALNKNGIYYVLNRYNLSAGPVWERALSGNSEKVSGDNISPSCYNGVVYAGSAGGIRNGHPYGGSVNAFDATTGHIIWSYDTPGRMVSPVTCTHSLIVDNEGRTVEVRNASDGNILFSYKTGGRLFGASVISNGVLYVPSSDGGIYVFAVK
jgi:outer membrane protein assembly factor BamB